jgi:hypothetical protein
MYGVMGTPESPAPNKGTAAKHPDYELDKDFIATFESFIASAQAKNIEMMIVVAPLVDEVDFSKSSSLIVMKTIAAKEHIPFFDFSNDTFYKHRYDLFADPFHLNDQGAHIFSQTIAEKIKADSLYNLAHK